MVAGWYEPQDFPVSGQTAEDLRECFVVEGLVEELIACAVQGRGMVAGLPDVQPDEHVNVLLIHNHRNTRSLVRPPLTRTAGRMRQ
jgi:hypothetical protein